MAEQEQNDGTNTGPAADGGNAGTAPAPKAADPQPDPQGQAKQDNTPAATDQAGQPGAEPPPADGGDATGSDTDADGIRDEAAYYRAQAEKFQRLHSKLEEQYKQAEQRLKERDDADAVQIRQQLEELQQAVTSEREKAAAAERSALKLKIAAKHGLGPELAERLVGDSEEAIAEDAERLAKLIPQSGRKPNVGNPAGDSTGLPGWMTKKVDPFSGE